MGLDMQTLFSTMKPRALVVGLHAGSHGLIRALREYEVTVAPTLAHALALLRQTPHALIILSMDQPQRENRRFFRAVRALPGYKHVPVVGMTSSAPTRAAHPAADDVYFLAGTC